jgi:ribosomal protein S18 acetylase RimI-like enzyme
MQMLPMSEKDYEKFYERALREYTKDVAQSNAQSIEESLPITTKQMKDLLPKGMKTEKNFFYCMYDDQEKNVGDLWFAVMDIKGRDKIFIFDIFVDASTRGQGIGKKALTWLEEKTRENSLSEIALHVFGHNKRAQKLYSEMGYEITSIQMVKKLT